MCLCHVRRVAHPEIRFGGASWALGIGTGPRLPRHQTTTLSGDIIQSDVPNLIGTQTPATSLQDSARADGARLELKKFMVSSHLDELSHAENPARALLEKLGWTYVPREVLASGAG